MKVLCGEKIFRLMDTRGLPLDIIVLELRDSAMAFNVKTFIDTALKSGWKPKRIMWTLKSANSHNEKGLEIAEKYLDGFQ